LIIKRGKARLAFGVNVRTLIKFVNSAINHDLSVSAPSVQQSGQVKTIQGGVLNSKAIFLPKPAYPAKVKMANAKGAVNVEVLVDKQGNVIEAKAISGNVVLRNSAELAARQAKFKPTFLSGKAVSIKGILIFNFAP